jgi:hypothetical protein
MPILNSTQRIWAISGLAALMLATRFHHFGSVSFLPDASLAVFFLAGYYLSGDRSESSASHTNLINRHIISFSLLIVLAGLIDYVAINFGGVSDWCISAAYLFLIPTYAVMYLAGRSCSVFNSLEWAGVFKIVMVMWFAATLAFVISNGSFYGLSGRYAETSGLSYVQQIMPYYVPYVGYAFVYFGLVLTVQILWLKSSASGAANQAG